MRRGLVLFLALGLVAAGASAARPKPRLTVISDSVGASLLWDAPAQRLVTSAFDANLQLAACRRLTTLSCGAGSTPPENALTLIHRLGRRLGPNVVMVVGYNDYPTVYAPGIEQVITALRAVGVEHIFWMTLHAVNRQYEESNSAIRAAARRHHQVRVIDWNRCAAGHLDWFGPDDIHLSGAGAQGLARCIRDAVEAALAAEPPRIDVELVVPMGVSAGFRAQLQATGGRAPYRFSVPNLPRGLHVTRHGLISGAPPTGRFRLRVHVRDARGRTTVVVTPLEISRDSR